jgi:hypothetical protein
VTTRILPPRIPLVDPRTGNVAREWYLYFLSLTDDVGGLQADPFGLGPLMTPTGPDVATVAQDALGLAPQIDAGGFAAAINDTQQHGIGPQIGDLLARVAALESAVNDLRLGAPVL